MMIDLRITEIFEGQVFETVTGIFWLYFPRLDRLHE